MAQLLDSFFFFLRTIRTWRNIVSSSFPRYWSFAGISIREKNFSLEKIREVISEVETRFAISRLRVLSGNILETRLNTFSFFIVYLKIFGFSRFLFFFSFVDRKGLLLIGSRGQTYRSPSRRNWPWPRGRCNLAFSLGAAARTLLSRWSFNRVTAPSNRARWRRTMKNMWETPIMERKEGGRRTLLLLRFEFSSREATITGIWDLGAKRGTDYVKQCFLIWDFFSKLIHNVYFLLSRSASIE